MVQTKNPSVGVGGIFSATKIGALNVAKCYLGEVKLERIGLRLPPIAVRDMQGGPLGSCRASLRVCS